MWNSRCLIPLPPLFCRNPFPAAQKPAQATAAADHSGSCLPPSQFPSRRLFPGSTLPTAPTPDRHDRSFQGLSPHSGFSSPSRPIVSGDDAPRPYGCSPPAAGELGSNSSERPIILFLPSPCALVSSIRLKDSYDEACPNTLPTRAFLPFLPLSPIPSL